MLLELLTEKSYFWFLTTCIAYLIYFLYLNLAEKMQTTDESEVVNVEVENVGFNCTDNKPLLIFKPKNGTKNTDVLCLGFCYQLHNKDKRSWKAGSELDLVFEWETFMIDTSMSDSTDNGELSTIFSDIVIADEFNMGVYETSIYFKDKH